MIPKRIEMPVQVEEILGKLREHGYEAFAVGGCVRDAILGRIPGDWDITTSAHPEEVKQVFGHTIDTGLQHGTVTVMRDHIGYEITTYRIDGEYEDGRHPKEVVFTAELREDLRRRDFTINAMAYSHETGIVDIFGGAEDLAGGVSPLNQLMQTIIALDAQLQASEQAYVTAMATLLTSTHDMDEDYYLDGDWIVDEVPLQNDLQATPEDAEADDAGIATYASGTGTSTAVSPANGVTLTQEELVQNLMAKKQYLEALALASNKLASELSGLMDDVSDAAKYTSELTDSLEMLTEDTAALYDSMDSYYPDLQASLDDTEELMNRTTEALNTSLSTAAIVQNTLKNSSDNLDAATRDSIRGTLELLDKSLSVLDSTASIRHAGVTMKEAIDKEWDDLDGDTRFLNMDPNAEKVSFTSDENQEPESVQIILRTAEISLDDDDEVLDAESEAASQSPLRRIWNVLVKMWKAFVEIFKNR